MRIGFHLTPFWSPTDRHPTRILDEAIEVAAATAPMGYAWVSKLEESLTLMTSGGPGTGGSRSSSTPAGSPDRA